jgi:hypothetical protein
VTIAEYWAVWSERHTTRHTFASTLLAVGVSVPATAEHLGHGAGVLLATYAHLPPGDHDRARSAVEAGSLTLAPVSRVCQGAKAATRP